MNTFLLRVTSPDGDNFCGAAVMLTVRGTEGELAVLAGHTPFVTALKPCTVKIETEDDEFYADIDGGILSVSKDETVLLSSSYKQKQVD